MNPPPATQRREQPRLSQVPSCTSPIPHPTSKREARQSVPEQLEWWCHFSPSRRSLQEKRSRAYPLLRRDPPTNAGGTHTGSKPRGRALAKRKEEGDTKSAEERRQKLRRQKSRKWRAKPNRTCQIDIGEHKAGEQNPGAERKGARPILPRFVVTTRGAIRGGGVIRSQSLSEGPLCTNSKRQRRSSAEAERRGSWASV